MLLLKLKLCNYRPHRLQLSHGLLTVQNYDQIVWNLFVQVKIIFITNAWQVTAVKSKVQKDLAVDPYLTVDANWYKSSLMVK